MASIKKLSINAGPGGSSITPSDEGPEGSTQSFKSMAPLVNSSGTLIEDTSNGTGAIVGFATRDASGTAATKIGYVPMFPGMEIEATLDTTLDGGNAPLTHALVATNMYGLYGLAKDAATGNWYIDQGDTSNPAVCVSRFIDPVGTVCARVIARFVGARSIWA